MGDVVRPIKQYLPAYNDAESRVLRVIAERYELCWPMPSAVKQADNIALATERRDVMTDSTHDWGHWIDGIEPDVHHITPLSPGTAKAVFMNQLNTYGLLLT